MQKNFGKLKNILQTYSNKIAINSKFAVKLAKEAVGFGEVIGMKSNLTVRTALVGLQPFNETGTAVDVFASRDHDGVFHHIKTDATLESVDQVFLV